ncbi:MAG: hypothetical protein DI527_09020 [Chelatococcus sp.]|nr:MAG: hypothetical protein DI527_09020 [Chelatococcus sp.]
MTAVEQALVEALNEQRLIIEALERRLAKVEAEERFALTESTPHEVIEFLEALGRSMTAQEERLDDLEQVVERRGLGTSWSPSRGVLMKIVEEDERRLG